MPLRYARTDNARTTSFMFRRSENSVLSNSRRPASIFEKSSRSLMTCRSASADDLTIERYSRCASAGLSARASSVIPKMAFIGVRISCDTLATNSLLAWLAASAASRAWRKSRAMRFRSVISVQQAIHETMCWWLSRKGTTETLNHW